MHILGIETSCDETAASVVENGQIVHSNIVSSSRDHFADLGGVVPEDAARTQVAYILPVLQKALSEAKKSIEDIDAIAVTNGPGLLGSLLVGVTAARTLSAVWKKPLIGVHHTLGHLTSTWLDRDDQPTFPVIALSVSGGHTDLWHRESHTKGTLLGSTMDDAAGEAFDKGAVQLGLSYPGGPAISKAASKGDETAHKFPKPLAGDNTLNFSFSGLKTALKYLLRDLDVTSPDQLTEKQLADIAASYEHAICDHLCSRITRALEMNPKAKEVHVVGGVSANKRLRSMLEESVSRIPVRYPAKISYCTDNAAMIAAAGYYLHQELGENAFAEFMTDASVKMH